MHIIRKESYKVSKWSGGTTTELFIFPPMSDYARRDFDFRISSAKIEIEESEFTLLPNIKRKLMILEGEIRLEHAEKYSKTLKEFDVDDFEGDWNTKSYGKAEDFNLMLKNGLVGELKHFSIFENESRRYEMTDDFSFFYLYKGEFSFESMGLKMLVYQGDSLIVDANDIFSEIFFKATKKCEIVFVRVKS